MLDSPLGVAANGPLVLEAPQFSGGEAPAGVGVAESCARSSRPPRPPRRFGAGRRGGGDLAVRPVVADELLAGVCDLDVDALDVELPRGFGRD